MSSAIEMESSGGRASNDSAVPYVSFPQLSSLLPYSAYVVLFVDGLVREPADEMNEGVCGLWTGQLCSSSWSCTLRRHGMALYM